MDNGEYQSGEELYDDEEEEEEEEESAPTTAVPVTPDEIPTSPRVVPLPVSLPASPQSISTSPSIPTSPKHTARDMPIDSLDQIFELPKTLPLSPKNIPASPRATTWDIPVDSLDRLLGSPKPLPTSPKTTPVSVKIIPAREVPVESLDKVLEEMETGTSESYLSPRLAPLPSTNEAEEESKRGDKVEEAEKEKGGEVAAEEEQADDEEEYDSDEEGSVIYRSEKIAGSVTLESSPSTSSVYDHPIHRSRELGVVSGPEDEYEEEGTEEDEMEAAEEEHNEKKYEKAEDIAEKQEQQVEKRKVEFCTVATQTDYLSPPPTPPPVKDHDEKVERVTLPLSEKEVKEVLAATAATPDETAKAAPTPVELTPAPAQVPAPAPAVTTPQPTTIATQTVIRETHYFTYVHTTDRFYWLNALTFLLLLIIFVFGRYFDMQKEHLYECGYPPEYKCLCLPVGWLGREEPVCKCIFWPRTC
ncbi:hypothetical protein BGX38DRAFT_1192694 [Terfezia claveryi]|nr:hypothetical protein BGX38DRAFT_1192694 [Terfezia claveryi]